MPGFEPTDPTVKNSHYLCDSSETGVGGVSAVVEVGPRVVHATRPDEALLHGVDRPVKIGGESEHEQPSHSAAADHSNLLIIERRHRETFRLNALDREMKCKHFHCETFRLNTIDKEKWSVIIFIARRLGSIPKTEK